MSKLPQIIKGHVKEFKGENQELFDKRYIFCKGCEAKGQELYGEICAACGCRLQAKLRLFEEVCPLDKWK